MLFVRIISAIMVKTVRLIPSQDTCGPCQDYNNTLLTLRLLTGPKYGTICSQSSGIISNVSSKVLLIISHRKTILMVYPQMKNDCQSLKSSYNCYKLLGFDIMLDANLTPWVLEVSHMFSSVVHIV